MFWQDLPAKPGSNRLARVQPPIPDTGWQRPTEYPNLRAARVLSIDTETKELDWDNGPGWARGTGHIVGVSIATEDRRWYFPMRHEVEPEWNLPPEHVLAWLGDSLSNPAQPKVGANLMYDVGWLAHEGVRVAGDLYDVQLAEALLSETDPVNVDALGLRYLGRGKETSLLYEWCAAYYGGNATGDQRKNIWRAPPRLVGPYAEVDAEVPLAVMPHQFTRMAQEGLLDVFYMENALIPLLIAMRFAGVTVDIDRANALRSTLLEKQQVEQTRLNQLAGRSIDVNKPTEIAVAFDALGLKYPMTPKSGKPSFTKTFLRNAHNPIADLIIEIRKLEKLRGTFLESYILGAHANGRVHGQFHLLRGDAEGTRSGRFSSSTPNLQNIPVRDEELAPLIRGMYIPDPGHRRWRKFDYSQIEYRFLVHFARGPGVDEAIRYFIERAAEADYHQFVIDLIRAVTGVELPRRPAKNMNFGLIYGMGKAKLIRELGVDAKAGERLFEAYHKAIPYAHEFLKQCSEEAERDGVITTILGRRSRFDLWEPAEWRGDSATRLALPFELAWARWGAIRRALTHKAPNRRLQGSAADLMKKAMLDAWRAGVFDYTGVPRLTVHDELDFSDPGDCDDAFTELKQIMESCMELRVPIRVDEEIGPDWGHTEKTSQ